MSVDTTEETMSKELGWYILKRESTAEWPFVKVTELEGPYRNAIAAALNQDEIKQGLILRYWDGEGWNTGRP